MNLRSQFWGSKVTKAGGAFAAEKISNFGPRKVGLKIIFRLIPGRNLCGKPALPNNFSLRPKEVREVFEVFVFLQFS
jgi:hypothetical protein